MKCAKCKKDITSEYIEIDNKVYHPECFVCEYCKNPITGEFRKIRGKFYHPECLQQSLHLVCDHCKKPIDDKWIEENGKKYHMECYNTYIKPRCKKCGLPIKNKYIKKDEDYYHPECYKQDVLPVCDICGKYIDSKYYVDKWGNKSHIEHNGEKTKLCTSCGRIISYKTSNNGVIYPDGRNVCGICNLTVVNSDAQILKAKHELLELFKKYDITGIPYDVPVYVVNKETFGKVVRYSVHPDSYGFAYSTIKSKNKKVVSMVHKIYIINGLPEVEFYGVLAHELLHIWINENDIKLKAKDLEGFCNLGSAIFYKTNNTKHATLLFERMYENKDRIYGAGFRNIYKIYEKYGIESVFDYIKKK